MASNWKRVREVFERALDYGPAGRSSYLDEACAGDDELRQEVEALLAEHARTGSFALDHPVGHVHTAVEAVSSGRGDAARKLDGAEEDSAGRRSAGGVAQPSRAVPAGARFGRYEIRAPLGAGGMGEVYLARDPKLGRDVAVKVLHAEFSADPERLRRFEQEAQAAGALNHPNILTVYDVAAQDGTPYVVSELLEGETLREHSGGAALPQRKALDYAVQIASGLAAAHGRGIVHRDLKPENIFVTKDGRVKILDFGIAKLIEPAEGGEALTGLPTRRLNTDSGVVIGTVGYMSPEQVRGRRVDQRSDIFSFGCVLYEMLAGRRAFQGDSAVETLNAILKEEPPDLSQADVRVAPVLERVVRHCLEKNPEQRFQSARDVAFDLETLSASGTTSAPSAVPASSPAPRSRLREQLPWLVAGLFVLTTGALTALYFSRGTSEARTVRFHIYPPIKGGTFEWITSGVSSAISPDGKRLALLVATEGRTQLFVRQLDSPDPQPLAGTEGAVSPFWSPDSRSLGFFADGKLKRVDVVAGGSPQTICGAPAGFFSGSWGRDGTILFTGPDGILRVRDAGGGEPAIVSKPDRARHESAYFWPYFLPDGRHYLYLSLTEIEHGGYKNEVLVGSLDSPEVNHLMYADSRAIYAPPGYLLYVQEGTLLAQAFDPDKLSLTGEPVAVAENLLYFQPIGRASFSASDNGVLAYQSGTNVSRLVWYNRDGAEAGTLGELADYNFLRLSPDGQRLAVDIGDRRTGTTDIWIYDLARGTPTHFTSDPNTEWSPVWSPDGKRIAFAADRGAPPFLFVKGLTDAGGGEPLIEPSGWVQFPTDWAQTPAGEFIIYWDGTAETGNDLMLLPLDGEHKPRPFLRTKFEETDGRFSPDGRFVAYVSNETGRREVYVRPFDGAGERWQVSTSGGFTPRWRRDGRELYYLTAEGNIMAVEVKAGGGFEAGKPTQLFHVEPAHSDYGQYEVTPDGQRFLVNVGAGTETSPVTVALNWAAGLRR